MRDPSDRMRVGFHQALRHRRELIQLWFVHSLHHGISRDAAGFHLQFFSGSLMVLLMAATSYVFTLCRLRSGSLWPSMVAHSTYNLVMIGGIFLYLT